MTDTRTSATSQPDYENLAKELEDIAAGYGMRWKRIEPIVTALRAATLRQSETSAPIVENLPRLIEIQCDDMATGTQMREFLRDDDGSEPLLREMLRLNLEQFAKRVIRALKIQTSAVSETSSPVDRNAIIEECVEKVDRAMLSTPNNLHHEGWNAALRFAKKKLRKLKTPAAQASQPKVSDEIGKFDAMPRRASGSEPVSAGPAHTNHPLRHFDRTCPACLAEFADAEERESAPSAIQGTPRKVTRYDEEGRERPDGLLVFYEDYAELERELAEMQDTLSELNDRLLDWRKRALASEAQRSATPRSISEFFALSWNLWNTWGPNIAVQPEEQRQYAEALHRLQSAWNARNASSDRTAKP